METNIQSVYSECESLAGSFGADEVLARLRDVQSHLHVEEPINILIIGENLSALTAIIKDVIEIPEFEGFNARTFGKNILMHFAYGNSFSISSDVKSEVFEETSINALCEAITSENQSRNITVNIVSNSEMLQDMRLTVIYRNNDVVEIPESLLIVADYLLWMTSASAPVMMTEKEYLRNHLLRYYVPSRFAFVVYGMESLNTDEDRDDVVSMVEEYLEGISVGSGCLLLDTRAVAAYIDKLRSTGQELRELRDKKLMEICVLALDDYLADCEKKASLDLNGIEALIKEFRDKEQTIRQMGETTAYDAENLIRRKLSSNFLAEIQDYNDQIFKNISDSIQKTDNPASLLEKVPEYIESAWDSFSREKAPELQAVVEEVIDDIYNSIERNTDEIFAGMDQSKQDLMNQLLEAFDIDVDGMPRADDGGQDKAQRVSKIMMFSAIPVTVFMGLAPGVLLAVGSVAVKKFNENQIATSAKGKIISSISETCHSVKREIYSSYNEKIDDLANVVRQNVLKAYDQYLVKILEELESLKRQAEGVSSRLNEIREIRYNQIPTSLKALE